MPAVPGPILPATRFNEFEGLGGDDTIIGNGNTRISFVNATARVSPSISRLERQRETTRSAATQFPGSTPSSARALPIRCMAAHNAGDTSEVFDGGAGNDILVGRGGFDQAVYNADQGTVSGIMVDMAAGTVIGDASIGTDTLNSIESIRGTNFADTYVAAASTAPRTICPWQRPSTNSRAWAAMTSSPATAIPGFRITSASAAVTVDLVAGTAHGTAAGDVANVGNDTFIGVNRVIGSNFNDTITGDGNDNVIEGGAGNDTIDGGVGNDTASYQHAGGGVTVDLNNFRAAEHRAGRHRHSDEFENLRGSDFNDTLTGNGLSPLEGRGGADHIIGHPGGTGCRQL